jgi:hypothetical protein
MELGRLRAREAQTASVTTIVRMALEARADSAGGTEGAAS